MSLQFYPEELRKIILGEDVIIKKCACCSGTGYESVGTGENEKYPDATVFVANLDELDEDWYWLDTCDKCEGVGYIIKFV